MNRLRPAVEDRFLCEFVSSGLSTADKEGGPVAELLGVLQKAFSDDTTVRAGAGAPSQKAPVVRPGPLRSVALDPAKTELEVRGPDVSSPGHQLAAHQALHKHYLNEYLANRSQLGIQHKDTFAAQERAATHAVKIKGLESQGVKATAEHHNDLTAHFKLKMKNQSDAPSPVAAPGVRAGRLSSIHRDLGGIAGTEPASATTSFPRSRVKGDPIAQRLSKEAHARAARAETLPSEQRDSLSPSRPPATTRLRPGAQEEAPRGTAVTANALRPKAEKSLSLLKSWNAINALSRLTL